MVGLKGSLLKSIIGYDKRKLIAYSETTRTELRVPPSFVTAVAGHSLLILAELMFLVFSKTTLNFFSFREKMFLERILSIMPSQKLITLSENFCGFSFYV